MFPQQCLRDNILKSKKNLENYLVMKILYQPESEKSLLKCKNGKFATIKYAIKLYVAFCFQSWF